MYVGFILYNITALCMSVLSYAILQSYVCLFYLMQYYSPMYAGFILCHLTDLYLSVIKTIINAIMIPDTSPPICA